MEWWRELGQKTVIVWYLATVGAGLQDCIRPREARHWPEVPEVWVWMIWFCGCGVSADLI